MAVIFQSWIALFAGTVAAAVACLPAELLVRQERHSWTSRARAMVFWAIMLSVYAVTLVGAQSLIRSAGLQPLFALDLTRLGAEQHWLLHLVLSVVLTLVPAFLFDFGYYWFHRLQHAVPLLWRWHSVHHAIEELNATNCHHHWTEGLVRIPMIVVPLTLLIDLRVPEVVIISGLLAAWGQVVHVVNPLDFGPLRLLFVSPRFHRVHHSLDGAHFDKNFAGVFPIFDVMFGTAYFPSPREEIRTGLADQREARTLRDYLAAR